MAKAVAIKHEIEDENTGAVATYHVIEYVSADFKYQSVTATVNGYVSKRTYEAGRNPLSSQTLSVNGLPEDGDVARDWLYRQAVAANNEGNSGVFAGAELVEEG